MSSIPGVAIGHGFTVRIGRGATPTWTSVAGWDDITFPDTTRADVDVTHNQSPDETEEFIPGLKAAADWQATMLYVQGNAADLLFKDLKATRERFLLEITPPGGTAVTWMAICKGYTPQLPIKGAMKAQVTLKVMAEVED